MTIGYSNFSTEEPVDSLTLTMLYRNADRLGSVAIPLALKSEDFAARLLS